MLIRLFASRLQPEIANARKDGKPDKRNERRKRKPNKRKDWNDSNNARKNGRRKNGNGKQKNGSQRNALRAHRQEIDDESVAGAEVEARHAVPPDGDEERTAVITEIFIGF